MQSYIDLLKNNKEWAIKTLQEDPKFFETLAASQSPSFLWIGCSDSRVPANQITGTIPGEIFVHRNIANMVVNTDLNLLSVLQYAVQVLKVKHIIVCGHYGCGGVNAAMGNQNLGIINTWLRNIKDVYRMHREEVNALPTEEERSNRLVELNVQEQVFNLAKTSIVQESWKERHLPHIHGWVYSLKDGVVKEVYNMNADSKLDEIYSYDVK